MHDDGSWRDFFENAPLAVQSVSTEGEVLWANQAQLELVGYSRDEYLGSHLGRFHADPLVGARLIERLASGETLRGYVASLRRRDGELRHVLIDAHGYRPSGRLAHARCFVRDVTAERREGEALAERARKLQAADRIKNELLATVSHELRTPLSAILGWARLLRAGRVDPLKQDQAMATIERNATAQARLIDELLDLARIANDKLVLDVHPVELGDIVAAAVETLRPAAESKGVALTCLVEPGIGPFLGDRSRLEQVFGNLISNAVKFTPHGGAVSVTLARDGDAAAVTVTDTGQGIPPELIPFVFDRFRQADVPAHRHQGGLGLGLAIVRHLVEAHGGVVHAHSGGAGAGTTLRVKLPLLPAPSDEPAARSCPPLASDLGGLRVLVVDGERDSREVVSESLRLGGAFVQEAADVDTALDLLQRARPDVLVADVDLDSLEGRSLIQRIRRAGHGVPACAVTAHAGKEERARLAVGFDAHVTKPVDPGALGETVARLARARGT
jgi:PAS domain S-box-containing protein